MKATDDASKKMIGTAKQQSMAVKELESEFVSMRRAVVGAVSAWMTIGGVVAVLDKLKASSEAARASMAASGKQMLQFASGSPGGVQNASDDLRRAAAAGVRYGIGPGESAAIFDWADQLAPGDAERRRRIAIEEMKLEKLGIAREDAEATMATLVRQGYDPKHASGYAAVGLDRLNLSGMAASSALAAGEVLQSQGHLVDKEVAAAVESAGNALSSAAITKYMGKLYAKAGIDPSKVSLANKLADMAAYIGTDETKLTKKFSMTKEDAKQFATLVQNREQFAAAQREIARTPTEYAENRYAVLRNVPALKEGYAQDERKAAHDFAMLYGPTTGTNMAQGNRARAAGRLYERNTWTERLLVGPNGEANLSGQMIYPFTTGANPGLIKPGFGPDAMTPDAVHKWVNAIDQNTAATNKLSNDIRNVLPPGPTPQGYVDIPVPPRIDRNAGL
jgi:hypothetical protein